MKYFGTSLAEHGHYIFEIKDMSMIKQGIQFNYLPFHPEELTNNLPKGEVIFYQGGGFTVIGISGSCKDTRPGTKSIFWVQEIITYNELKNQILNNAITKAIIDTMSFKIKWRINSGKTK